MRRLSSILISVCVIYHINGCRAQQTLVKKPNMDERTYRQLQYQVDKLEKQMAAVMEQNTQLIQDNDYLRREKTSG